MVAETQENTPVNTLERAATLLRSLGDANRLRIVARLAQGEACVCDVIDDLDMPQSLASYHLGKLRKEGLVRARRDAQWIYYSLDPAAWQSLRGVLGELLPFGDLPQMAAYGAAGACAVSPDAPQWQQALADLDDEPMPTEN